ncbi:MAG: hypothetical protein P1P89_19315 [Desulfobacterales bacterium]|nr:hypothetical protein [Desulfobacterales bacterium]
MNKSVDPATFGLHSGTRIEKTGKETYVLIIQRKSRIIMKDGRNILAKAAIIQSAVPEARVDVHTSAPVCSKTRQFLQAHGITIEAMK